MPDLPECYPFRSAESRERYLAHYDGLGRSRRTHAAHKLVDTEHGTTSVWVGGPADAPALVVLPGAWGHALSWPPRFVEIVSERFRTHFVDDMCDVGRSVNKTPLRTADDFMGWLDGLFDALGLGDSINLMGISRGGWLTGEYLLHAPDRLAKAALLSPALVVVGPSLRSFRSMPHSFACTRRPSVSTVDGLMRHLMPYLASTRPEAFDAFVRETALGLECFDTTRVCGFWGPRAFSRKELAGISTPVLYLVGADEIMSSPKAAVARLRAFAPAFETEVFPEASHDLIDVHTEAVGRRIADFMLAG